MSVALRSMIVAAWTLLSFSTVACGAPPGSGRARDEGETSGDDDGADRSSEDEAEDAATRGGRWAPRGSLARVEDIPRRGLVEERPSRTGAVRVIALVPLDGTGNHLLELIGLPALARDEIVASVRAAHDSPIWIGCGELVFISDGTEYAVDDATHEGGVTPLGVMEAVQGRVSVSRLEAAAAGGALTVRSCEEEWGLADGAATLRDFVSRFRGLRPAENEPPAPGAEAGDLGEPEAAAGTTEGTEGTDPAIVDPSSP